MRNNPIRFKAVLTYDGTGFSGWQVQPDKKTIQSEIERVLSQILQQKIKVHSCGRTDSGVHASRHYISFVANTDLKPEKIMKGMNALLDEKIKVKEISVVDKDFHVRFDVARKIYRYLISNFNSPFLINRAWFIPEKLSITRMKKAASFIVGTHDFSCFQASGSSVKNTVRTIDYIKIKREYFCFDPEIRLIFIEVCGDGFLYKMVRNIAGTLVDAGRGKIEPEQVKKIIDSKDRKLASATAPAWGLYLKDVIYERER